MKWLRGSFPGIPDWLVVRSLPVPGFAPVTSPYHIPGLNRRSRKALKKAEHVVVHMFSGRTKPLEFRLGGDTVVVNVDALCQRDLLDERVFASLIALCMAGKVDAVIGGPPCGTNSPFREQARAPDNGDGGPQPIRGRTGNLRYGLPTNTEAEQKLVEDHSVLVTRFLVVHTGLPMCTIPLVALGHLRIQRIQCGIFRNIRYILNNHQSGHGRSCNRCGQLLGNQGQRLQNQKNLGVHARA